MLSTEHWVFMRLRPIGEFLLTPPLSESVAWSPDLVPPFTLVNSPSSPFNLRVPVHCIELDS